VNIPCLISWGDLSILMETALDAVGQEIATFVAQQWGDALFDMSRVLLVGGGAHYFAHAIQERLPFAKVASRPETANAAGYGSLAEVLVQALP
jgi:hypothetical protein